jgi:hypothetical protein
LPLAVWKCGVPNVGLVLRANTNNFRANADNWSIAPGAAGTRTDHQRRLRHLMAALSRNPR